MKMIVGDLSSIEYGVVGWLARCPGIIQVLRDKKDPYIEFATKLYFREGFTYEQLKAEYDLFEATKGAQGRDDFRQNSKPPVLGCGFGLSGGEEYVNEFKDKVRGGLWGYAWNVCGVDMPKELAHEGVRIYRESYPEVPQLWQDMNLGFKRVLQRGGEMTVGKETWNKHEKCWDTIINEVPHTDGAFVTFSRYKSKKNGYIMRMELPSGRFLHYLNAQIQKETVMGANNKPWTRDVIFYEGIEHSAITGGDGSVKKGAAKWGMTRTYGGKLTENAVQAIARDILVNGAHLSRKMGFKIFGLFHDELATMVDGPFAPGLSDLLWCMSQPPKWASTMLLSAAGWEGTYYRKA